jgi:hypothetical protein
MFGWFGRLTRGDADGPEDRCDRYARFTDRARKVMDLAEQEALRFRHEYIGTEHVLLGLIAEESGVAANVLKNLNIEMSKVRQEVERIVSFGPLPDVQLTSPRPHTPRTKTALEYAREEARQLNHNYVGTEHLLLGLVCEGEGVAAQVLMDLGLKPEAVRAEVLTLLLGPGAPTPEQLQIIRDHISQLAEQQGAFLAARDFDGAARRRDEVNALKRLVAWYEWARGPR